nr:hypothetical protein [Tanacetum cinerariifolium]
MALDEALVATTNRLKIGKVNQRLSPDLKSIEATIQVVLDALKLTPEYLVYQVENKNAKKNNDMHYPRFTKVIIDLYMSKDYQDMLESKAYKEHYAFASGAVPPKAKTTYKKKAKELVSSKIASESAFKGPRLKTQAKMKHPAKKTKAKGLTMLTEVALSKVDQLKLATKISKKDFHISHASISGDGVGKLLKVLDEQEQEDTSTDEGTDTLLGVSYVPKYEYEKFENDDDGSEEDEYVEKSAHIQSDEDNFDYEESNDDDESTDNEEDEEIKELYDDVNINLGNTDAEMTNADQGTTKQYVYQEKEDAHVTLTHVHDATKADEPLQSSSISFDFTSKFLNL